MYRVVGFLILLLFLLAIYYSVKSFKNLSVFKNIKNKFLVLLLSFIPLVIIFILFNTVNAIVVLAHYSFFLLMVFLVMKLLKKDNKDILVIVSVIITSLYLCYGAYQAYHVYETKYDIYTTKDIENIKIIQIADTHIGATFDGKGFRKHIEKISKIDSDLFVITGDFIDDDTTYEDMVESCASLSLLKSKYGVYYVNGNHDKGYYTREYTYNDFLDELRKNNVNILIDEVKEITNNVVLVGREDRQYSRKTIDDLVNNIDKSKYIIDLNHQPNDYDNEEGNVDLVLSGHTHGGQFFPIKYIGPLLKIDDEFYGLHTRKNTNFIVTSGMSDWAIDFKTGTYSEYVIINIHGDSYEKF